MFNSRICGKNGVTMTRKNLDISGKVCPHCLEAVRDATRTMKPGDDLVVKNSAAEQSFRVDSICGRLVVSRIGESAAVSDSDVAVMRPRCEIANGEIERNGHP